MGKSQNVKGGTHQNCQLPFFSYSPNHLLLPEVGWVGYCMGWARYDSPNSNWRSHQFLRNAFWLLGKAKTQKRRPFCHASTFSCFPHHFSFTWALSGIQNFLCVKPFTFLVVTSLCSGWEIIFLEIPSEWERRPMILGVIEPILAMIGPIRLRKSNCY